MAESGSPGASAGTATDARSRRVTETSASEASTASGAPCDPSGSDRARDASNSGMSSPLTAVVASVSETWASAWTLVISRPPAASVNGARKCFIVLIEKLGATRLSPLCAPAAEAASSCRGEAARSGRWAWKRSLSKVESDDPIRAVPRRPINALAASQRQFIPRQLIERKSADGCRRGGPKGSKSGSASSGRRVNSASLVIARLPGEGRPPRRSV